MSLPYYPCCRLNKLEDGFEPGYSDNVCIDVVYSPRVRDDDAYQIGSICGTTFCHQVRFSK
jgi:hypothetical protein